MDDFECEPQVFVPAIDDMEFRLSGRAPPAYKYWFDFLGLTCNGCRSRYIRQCVPHSDAAANVEGCRHNDASEETLRSHDEARGVAKSRSASFDCDSQTSSARQNTGCANRAHKSTDAIDHTEVQFAL